VLLLLIPIAWLVVVTVLLAVCQAAARGDASSMPGEEAPPEVIRPGLVVWEESAARALRADAAAQRRHATARGRQHHGDGAGGRRTTARGVR
jgi:hypothetical protein